MSLFFLKTKDSFKNNAGLRDANGLTYNSTVLEDLLQKDTDHDGAMDWEENLQGTDPNNKDTDGDGVLDGKEKIVVDSDTLADDDTVNSTPGSETDKFSQDLASTIAAISQTGEMDAATVDQLSNNLLEQIATKPPEKVYAISDLKIVDDTNNKIVAQNYYNSLIALMPKSSIGSVLDILNAAMSDGENIDSAVLSELGPIVEIDDKVVAGMNKMEVPKSLALAHLNVLNDLASISGNLKDIQVYDTDAIKAITGIAQYQKNSDLLTQDVGILKSAVNEKLNY